MLKKIVRFLRGIQALNGKLDVMQLSLGRIESRQLSRVEQEDISAYEFKVFSQSGEDGIIQHLVNSIDIKNKTFVEFGVEDYLESNTRFLALNNYWSGLVIDGSPENIAFIKRDPIYWRCNIKAECSFITKDNINDILERNGIRGEIGLLSVDIDGNDYWVWKAIKNINPCIVIAEYNSFFGAERKVTVPYDPSFVRTSAHYSKIYYGASIAALNAVAQERGYKLVATNKAGNNVFFVRADLMGNLKELSVQEAYREINYRETHDEQGQLTYPSFQAAKVLIGNLRVHDVDLGQEILIKSL